MRKPLLLLFTMFVLIFVSACGGGNDSTSSDGESSNGGSGEKLVVYTAIEADHMEEHIELFRQQYPDVDVEIVRDSSGVIVSRILAEKDNPVADVIWGLSNDSLILFAEEGLLEPYNPEGYENLIPEFTDQVNDPMLWTGISAYFTVIVANKPELERLGLPIPTSYEDLLDPQYKGLITMPSPASSGTGFLTVSGILQTFDSEEEGWEYLDGLHENIAQYTHSGSKPAVDASTGEYPIGISFDGRAVPQAESGAPIELVFPKEGSGWTLEGNALLKKDNIKDEAKLFLDWANSQEAMESYAKYFALTGIQTDVEKSEFYPDDVMGQLIENDLYWAAENRIRIVDTWASKYDGKTEPEEE